IFTDVDGDLVSVSTSKGSLTAANFVLIPTGLGAQLATMALESNSAFQGTDIEITVERAAGGNGQVNVGYIDATGIDLGHVHVEGDLAQIDAGDSITPQRGLLGLHAQSLGKLGLATQLPEGTLQSDIQGALKKLRIENDVTNAALFVTGDVRSIVIGGDLFGGSIRSGGQLGAIHISGDVTASDSSPAIISAAGTLAPANNGQALAIAGIHIGGSVRGAEILAGYDISALPVNPDVRIGKVRVRGDWIGSSMVTGADAGEDGLFGTADDSLIAESNSIVARIASILIRGVAAATDSEFDHYGIVGEQITSLTVNALKVPLKPGASDEPQPLPIDGADDFSVLEVFAR
ncbi:MAG TPA: hypothetical protein VFD22_03270, partial [Gemmatimonadaceae bacterium]|nr:hypothetical protein [Gemmatimonadaceae bacterium]